MDLQDLVNISQILQAVLVVVSLGLIWYQLREGTRLAKAENARALIVFANEFDSMISQNAELTELWYSYGKGLERRGLVAQKRYRKLLVQRLVFHEFLYYQVQQKLLDQKIYDVWGTDLKRVVRLHNLDTIAGPGRVYEAFPGEFGKYLEKIRRENC